MEAQSATLILACALSSGEYAQRIRDFRRLFAATLLDHRREPNRLRLVLDNGDGREEAMRNLLHREQECCPFFTFAVAATEGTLIVEAGVPIRRTKMMPPSAAWAGTRGRPPFVFGRSHASNGSIASQRSSETRG
jgi:hypothetical protein